MNKKNYTMRAVTLTLLVFAFSSGLFATQERKTLALRLESPTGNSATTTLYFDEGITPSYDVHEDAPMVFSNVPSIPEIYSYTLDKVACSINGCGTLQTYTQVSLGYTVGYAGNYTFSASLVDNFDPTSIIKLYDSRLGITTDLRENFYQVEIDSNDLVDNRFFIQITSAIQYTSSPSNCANTGGTITIIPDSSITWDLCQLFDSANQVLQTINDVTGTITFTGLAAGTYHVVYTYNSYSASNTFFLNGNYVTASIGVPAQPIFTNQDVIFNAFTTNSVNYTWDFGDSTIIIGVANPTQVYLVPGTYTVNLFSSNDVGCSATAQAVVTVVASTTGINSISKNNATTVISFGKTVVVNMNDAVVSQDAQIFVYNLLGQSVVSLPITSQSENINMQNQSTGYYLVSIRNSGIVNTKRVIITGQ
jgi:hypothetical protein